jgi:hypothetical protein
LGDIFRGEGRSRLSKAMSDGAFSRWSRNGFTRVCKDESKAIAP